MRFQHGMSMALYAGMLLADITDEMIARTLEWRRDGHEIKRGGPLDVRLGRVMRASGFLDAARYYVPEIKTVPKITLENGEIKWEREYGKDWAAVTGEGKCLPPPEEGNAARYKERYCQTMIYMFPSVDGSVDIGRGEGDSLVRFLDSQDEGLGIENKKSPKILAALMAMGLGAKLDAGDASSNKPIKSKKNEGKNDIRIRHGEVVDVSVNLRKFPSVRNIIRFFEDGVEYEFNSLDKEFHLLSKGPLLHAFIHYYFNEYEELESFIDAFYDIVKRDEKMLERCFAEEDNPENRDSKAFLGLYRTVTDAKSLGIVQTIPFTPTAPQIRDEGAYFYNRRTGEFRRDEKFGGCVEAVLLSSLYCLFFDPSQQRCRLKKALVEDLEKAELELRRELAGKYEGEELELRMRERLKRLNGAELVYFFRDYPLPEEVDEAKEERWWRIVEDLDNGRIVYCKRRTDDEGHVYRGELCTGLINFLRVVVKICGLDGSEYLSGFAEYRERPSEDDGKEIIKEFKEQFEKVMRKLCDKEVVMGYPYGLKMKEVGRSGNKQGWDIVGSVEVNMRDEMGRDGHFTLVQQDIHAKLDMKNASVSIPEEKLNELRRHVDELTGNLRRGVDIYLQGAIHYYLASVSQLSEHLVKLRRRLIESSDYLGFLAFTPLQNDEQRIAQLKELFPYVVGNGDSRTEQLVENILNSLALDVDVTSRSVHLLVAFNTRFRKKYAAILERHTMAPRDAPNEQCSWLCNNEVRKQCILSFYDKPELDMYLGEVDIVYTIAWYEDNAELLRAVQHLPDARIRHRVNACGVMVACKSGNMRLAQYFFSNLEVANDVVFQAQLQYSRYYNYANLWDLRFVAKFFLEQAGTAPEGSIRKMYSWCFDSKGIQCLYCNIFPFVQATHKKVGLDFVFDQVMRMRDLDRIENFDPSKENTRNRLIYWTRGCLYTYFYAGLLIWIRTEGMLLRRDVYDLVGAYIEQMDRESQAEGSKYFEYDTTEGIERFRWSLAELRSLLEDGRWNSGSNGTSALRRFLGGLRNVLQRTRRGSGSDRMETSSEPSDGTPSTFGTAQGTE